MRDIEYYDKKWEEFLEICKTKLEALLSKLISFDDFEVVNFEVVKRSYHYYRILKDYGRHESAIGFSEWFFMDLLAERIEVAEEKMKKLISTSTIKKL